MTEKTSLRGRLIAVGIFLLMVAPFAMAVDSTYLARNQYRIDRLSSGYQWEPTTWGDQSTATYLNQAVYLTHCIDGLYKLARGATIPQMDAPLPLVEGYYVHEYRCFLVNHNGELLLVGSGRSDGANAIWSYNTMSKAWSAVGEWTGDADAVVSAAGKVWVFDAGEADCREARAIFGPGTPSGPMDVVPGCAQNLVPVVVGSDIFVLSGEAWGSKVLTRWQAGSSDPGSLFASDIPLGTIAFHDAVAGRIVVAGEYASRVYGITLAVDPLYQRPLVHEVWPDDRTGGCRGWGMKTGVASSGDQAWTFSAEYGAGCTNTLTTWRPT